LLPGCFSPVGNLHRQCQSARGLHCPPRSTLTHDLGLDRSAPGIGELLLLPAVPRKRLMAQKGLRGVYQGLIGCADPVRETYLEDPGRILRIFEGFGVSECSFETQPSRLDDSKLKKWQFCGTSWRFLNSL